MESPAKSAPCPITNQKYSELKPINRTGLFTYGTPADVALVQNTPHFIRY